MSLTEIQEWNTLIGLSVRLFNKEERDKVVSHLNSYRVFDKGLQAGLLTQ